MGIVVEGSLAASSDTTRGNVGGCAAGWPGGRAGGARGVLGVMFRMLVRGALLGHCGTLVVGLRLEQAQGDSVGYAGLLESVGPLEHLDGVGSDRAIRQANPLGREVVEG